MLSGLAEIEYTTEQRRAEAPPAAVPLAPRASLSWKWRVRPPSAEARGTSSVEKLRIDLISHPEVSALEQRPDCSVRIREAAAG